MQTDMIVVSLWRELSCPFGELVGTSGKWENFTGNLGNSAHLFKLPKFPKLSVCFPPVAQACCPLVAFQVPDRANYRRETIVTRIPTKYKISNGRTEFAIKVILGTVYYLLFIISSWGTNWMSKNEEKGVNAQFFIVWSDCETFFNKLWFDSDDEKTMIMERLESN